MWSTDLCIGLTVISLSELLEKCADGEGACINLLSPSRKAASSVTGTIQLRLETSDAISSARDALRSAQQDVQKPEMTISVKASESKAAGFTEAVFELGEQNEIYEILGALMAKLNIFVELIDDLSEIHPYAHVAWQLASAIYKSVSNQFEADKRIIDLVRAMKDAFTFVSEAQSLPEKVRSLEQAITSLLKQTIECCLFIRNYTSHSFGGRMLDLSGSQKITEFEESLASLKKVLDSGLVLNTAVVLARASRKVDALFLEQRLEPYKASAFNRTVCLSGTRVAVRSQIMDQLMSDSSQNILWLYGVAGSGKSTVSNTITDYVRGLSRLGASLFFERGKCEPDVIIRTLACRLASFDTCIAPHIIAAVERDNGIATASASSQFEKLLLEPLVAASSDVQGPIIVVIDALDECGTAISRRNLMRLFQNEFPKLPKALRFLITSRPEPDISNVFSSQPNTVYSIGLDYTSASSHQDVLSYIRDEMEKAVRDQVEVPKDWPWDANMALLGEVAAGLFVWASAAVRRVSLSDLDDLVKDSRSLNRIGLGEMYASVLQGSGISWESSASRNRFSQIFGLILLSKAPLSIACIDGLLGYPPEKTSHLVLSRLRCLLEIDLNGPVRLFHTSFSDYMLSPERSGDPWFIDISAQRAYIASRCFAVMKCNLRFNICNLESSFIPNDTVPGLSDRVRKNIPEYLDYSCRYWAQHLLEQDYTSELTECLSDLLHNYLLYWLEVLSLIKETKTAIYALRDVASWLSMHDAAMAALVKDAQMLIEKCIVPISISAPHIYLSMLTLASDGSEVAMRYANHSSSVVTVDRRGTKRPSPLIKEVRFKEGKHHFHCVAFSHDSTRMVSSTKNIVEIWDTENGAIISGPHKLATSINSLAFSSDDTLVLIGSANEATFVIWDIKGEAVANGPIEGHEEPVQSSSFLHDRTRIITGSYDCSIKIWDTEKGMAIINSLEGHTECVSFVSFLPIGTQAISCSEDRTIRVWDTKTNKSISEFQTGHRQGIHCAALSSDGSRIVTSSNNETAEIWDVESGELVAGPLEGHDDYITTIVISRDGKRVVTGSADCTIRVWSCETGALVAGPFSGHKNMIMSVTFSPDDTRIISCSDDTTVIAWNADSGIIASDPSGDHIPVADFLAYSTDGNYIASGSLDGTTEIWNIDSGSTISNLFPDQFDGIDFDGFPFDDMRHASSSIDKLIMVWDSGSGKAVSVPFKDYRIFVNSVAISPNRNHVASGSYDNSIRVLDLESGAVVSGPFVGHTKEVNSIAFSLDGARLVSGSSDKTAIVWDIANGKLVSGPFKGHTSYVTSVGFSPDGSYVISGSSDKTIRTWSIEKGDYLLEPFKGHNDVIRTITYSPRGTHIVSSSEDGTIRIWKAESNPLSSEPQSPDESPLSSEANMFSTWTLGDDGWIRGKGNELILWAPPDIRPTLWHRQNTGVLSCEFSTRLDFTRSTLGECWAECFSPPM